MANETLGANFSINITDLKSGLAQANRLIRESESEFKAAAAGMDDWSSSQEGLEARIKHLNSTQDLQQKKVEALKEEYARLVADGMDEASVAAVKLRTDINKEQAALNKTEKELEDQTKALELLSSATEQTEEASKDAANEIKDLGEESEKTGGKLEGLKKVGGIVSKAILGIAGACVGAVGAFLSLGESTQETQTAMAKLNQAFDTAGLGAKAADETITDLYGVLGDMDRATEASNLLAKMSKDEADLESNTRILTGVFAEFGDSIPTEGLAEGMQATAQMGEVQGVLADALEWQGINLDTYNSKLASMSSAEERAAYIQSTLIDLYGQSADGYRENNKELITSNEAQLKLNQTLAETGRIAMPIMTTLKNLATGLLEAVKPFVELIGNGLKGALEGTKGAADQLAQGLSGILTTVLNKIVSMVPFIIDTLVAIIPELINSLLDQLPDILSAVINMITKIIEGLSKMLPQIVSKIMELIPLLINSLIAAIPQLLQAAIQLLMAIVNALPTIITELINALPTIIDTVITALIEAIPLLIDGAIQFFNAIIEALPTIIQALKDNLPSIINTIIDGLIEALPLVLDGAIQLLMAIVDAIPTIVDMLVVQLPSIISTIVTTLIQNLPKIIQAAVDLFMGIIEAIPQIVVELIKNMPQIISSIVEGLLNGIPELIKAGGDLLAGLFEGLLDPQAIWDAVKGLFNSIMDGIFSIFDINSPSKVMENLVGKNLALGIGEGFKNNIGDVNKEIQQAMDFDEASVNVKATKTGNMAADTTGADNVVVYQTNNFSQAHSRYELFKTAQQTKAAVKLAMGGV